MPGFGMYVEGLEPPPPAPQAGALPLSYTYSSVEPQTSWKKFPILTPFSAKVPFGDLFSNSAFESHTQVYFTLGSSQVQQIFCLLHTGFIFQILWWCVKNNGSTRIRTET